MKIFQCIGLSWIYGMPEFFKDMETMRLPVNKPIKIVLIIEFVFIIPVVIATLFGYNLVNAEDISYRTYVYPDWVQSLGWFIMILPLVLTGLYVIWYFIIEIRGGLSFKETVLQSIRPTKEWYLLRDFDHFANADDVEGDGSDDDSSVGSSSKNSSRKSSLRKDSDTDSTAKVDYD